VSARRLTGRLVYRQDHALHQGKRIYVAGVAIGNNKGGSAKTATTVQLAAALALRDRRVLVVDLDPQANVSRRLGFRFDRQHPVPTISEAIKAGADGVAQDAIVPCSWDHPAGIAIDLVPSRFDLEARISEAGTVGAVRRLQRALSGVVDQYDVVLYDLPPSLGHLTQLGLVAADVALCVTEPEYDSIEGAIRFRDFISRHRHDLGNPGLALAGVVVARVRPLNAHVYQVAGLAGLFGTDLIWAPHIPERAAVKEAADAALPLQALNDVTARTVATLYESLADRLEKEIVA
jgi:chromosome partitioning protein